MLQRFRYKHLDPTSHAGKLAGLIRAHKHREQHAQVAELPENTLLARLANMVSLPVWQLRLDHETGHSMSCKTARLCQVS